MIYCSRVGKNKAIEMSTRRDLSSPRFEISLVFSTKCSHAGLFFMFCFYKFQLEINIYDIRHWDYDNNCFEKLIKGDKNA